MADIIEGLLLESNKVFIPSADINIFPCARRGQNSEDPTQQYDPEARLNTERTNRLHTAINGFKDSFIISENFTTSATFIFVIAGHRVEIKNFNPALIADVLGNDTKHLYAYIRLQPNISLDIAGYATKILYRQSASPNDSSYLDVTYTNGDNKKDFFTGISFVKDEPQTGIDENNYYLLLCEKIDDTWELVQTSLLPHIEHGETEDSIKLLGDFTVKHGDQVSFEVTESKTVLGVTDISKLSAGATDVDSLTVNGTTYLKGTAQIDGETTLYNKLLVKSGNTTRAEIDSSKVSFNLPVTANDTLSVKRTTGTGPAMRVEGSLEVTNSISTETINVNTLQSVDTLKTDKAAGLVITSTADSPERTLKIEGKTDISGDTGIDGRLTVNQNVEVQSGGNIVVTKGNVNITEGNINLAKGGISLINDTAPEAEKLITKNLQATNNATIYDLDVGTNIDTGTLKAATDIVTPALKTNTITSDNTEIVVDKTLKVDTINSDSTKGLTVEQATKLKKTLTVDGATIVNDTITAEKLVITDKDADGAEKGEIDTPQLSVNRITSNEGSITVDNKKLIVNKSLEMLAKTGATDPATATVEKAIIGDLTVKLDSNLKSSTGKITAKEVVAEKITQNGNQVPAITLEQISDNGVTPEVWQLQIANVIKKPKN